MSPRSAKRLDQAPRHAATPDLHRLSFLADLDVVEMPHVDDQRAIRNAVREEIVAGPAHDEPQPGCRRPPHQARDLICGLGEGDGGGLDVLVGGIVGS